MSRKFYSILASIILLINIDLNAQTTGIQWQETIGGSEFEWASQILIADDGDIFAIGLSNSKDADNPLIGFEDVLLTRFSKDGTKKWSKNYGHPFSSATNPVMAFTSDGGLIIGCKFMGYDEGLPGQHSVDLLKVASDGTVTWEKEAHYANLHVCAGIAETADKGFLLCAGDGINFIKFDSDGNVVGNQLISASINNNASQMIKTIDGGFAVVGLALAADGDFVGWSPFLLKVDGQGVKEWVRCYTNGEYNFTSVVQDADGRFYIGGDGQFDFGNSVYESGLVEKLDDRGNLIWRKIFKGNNDNCIFGLALTKDDGVAFCGRSQANDGDLIDNVYRGDFWVGKIRQKDAATDFQAFFGGPVTDFTSTQAYAYSLLQLSDGALLVFGVTDQTNPYVQNFKGNHDMWLVKLGAANTIKGSVFVDANGNGIKDLDEKPFDVGRIVVKGEKGDSVIVHTFNGNFVLNTDSGSYTSTLRFENPYYSVANSIVHSTFHGYGNTDSFFFPVVPIPGKTDLQVQFIPLSRARPFTAIRYRIVYRNRGSEDVSAVAIKASLDPRLSQHSAVPRPTTSSGSSFTWSIPVLHPLDSGAIDLLLSGTSGAAFQLGDTLTSVATISPAAGDLIPQDDTAVLKQPVTSSYDPNDKTEANGGVVTASQINNGAFLNYTIRFQNTGNDTAFKIIVRDTLENRLDGNTLEMVAASHPYQLTIEKGRYLTWLFDNIRLPDSTANEPLSHGFLSYRVRPTNTVKVGDVIHNTAGIYFDFNKPVATNDATTLILKDAAVVSPVGDAPLIVTYPNPVQGDLTVQLPAELTGKFDIQILTIAGRLISSMEVDKNARGEMRTTVSLGGIAKGRYVVRIVGSQKTYTQALLVL